MGKDNSRSEVLGEFDIIFAKLKAMVRSAPSMKPVVVAEMVDQLHILKSEVYKMESTLQQDRRWVRYLKEVADRSCDVDDMVDETEREETNISLSDFAFRME